METLSWKCIALIAIALCSLAMAAPAPQESLDALSPVEAGVSTHFHFLTFSIYFYDY